MKKNEWLEPFKVIGVWAWTLLPRVLIIAGGYLALVALDVFPETNALREALDFGLVAGLTLVSLDAFRDKRKLEKKIDSIYAPIEEEVKEHMSTKQFKPVDHHRTKE
jgi:hypothetical protein